MNYNKSNLSVAVLLISAISLMATMVSMFFLEPEKVFDSFDNYESIITLLFSMLLLLTVMLYFLSIFKRVKPKKYIYISYSNDNKEIVGKIINELNELLSRLSKYRFDILTHQDVSLGEDYYESIKTNINKSEFFIVIVSQSYLEKAGTINEFEKIIQKNNKAKIIPIVLDSFDDLAKLPENLSNIKALPLFNCDSEKEFTQQIRILAEDLIKYRKD